MEASEPKWVNPTINITVVNSLRLGSHHIYIWLTVRNNDNYLMFLFIIIWIRELSLIPIV